MVNFKKICAWTLSAMMALSALPQAMAEDNATGYTWIEAENFTVNAGDYKIVEEANVSGGNYLLTEDTKIAVGDISYKFTVPADGMYDMDILSTKINVDYMSAPKWKLNDGEFNNMGGSLSDPVFTSHYGSLNNQPLSWYQMGKVSLEKDTEYTLTIQTPRRTGPGNAWNDMLSHAFDAIAVVPSDWSWIPDGINKPSLELHDYLVLNGTNFYETNGYIASNSSIVAFGMLADYAAAPTVTYKLALKNAGAYDIWVDCEDSYGGGVSLASSATQFAVGETDAFAKITADVLGATTESIYNPKRGVIVNCGWQKAGKANLSAGINTLKFQATADAYSYWSVIRRIIVVPSSYLWNPSISDTPSQQELPEYAMLNGNDFTSNVGYEIYETGVHATLDVPTYSEQGITPELTYEFLLAADDKYDIWVDCENQYAPSGATAYAIGENGSYTGITNAAISSTTGTLPNTHRGVWVNCAWKKAGTETLSAGSNILKLSVGAYDGYQDYWSMIRRIVVVPSAYNWKPTISEIPSQQPIPEYVYFNANEATTVSGYKVAGDAMKIDDYASNLAETPKLTFDFVVQETAPYDIWINCGVGNSSSQFPNAYAIGANEPTTIYAQANGASTGTVNMFSAVNVEQKWRKVDTVSLRKNRTLTLTLQPGSLDSYGRYWSTFKSVAIVPASWNWSPNQSETPCKIENNGIIWTEAETMPGLSSKMVKLGSGDSSSGMNLYIIESNAVNFGAERVVTIPESGEYSIYALASNPATAVYTDYKLGIDGTYINATQAEGFTAFLDSGYRLSNGINMNWLKLADTTFTAGAHSIGFTCDEVGSDNRYIFGLDAFVIVPKNDAIDLTGLNAAEGVAALQASAIKLADDLSNVTENLVLPTTLANETSIAWASDNEAVNAQTGAVTRGAIDQNVALTATFTWLNAGTTYTTDIVYNITVPAIAAYEVADFKIDGEIAANATLTASATMTKFVDGNPSATLAIALYKGGRLMAVKFDAKAYTEGTEYFASVTLPEDVTGYTVKAFLLDTETQKPLSDAI